MKRPLLIASLALVTLASLGATEAMAKGAKLKVEDSDVYGRILVNGGGKALYLFTKEAGPTADCYGECAAAWPPFLTSGKPSAGTGLSSKRLGTTIRSDGTRQVTFKGHPLYFYVHDTPDRILCQDVFEFGGTWLLVNQRGNAVR